MLKIYASKPFGEITMAVKCVSCNREVTDDYVRFKCPGCKRELIRCMECRNNVTSYKCPECALEGP